MARQVSSYLGKMHTTEKAFQVLKQSERNGKRCETHEKLDAENKIIKQMIVYSGLFSKNGVASIRTDPSYV